MLFKNREAAGRKLADALAPYKGRGDVIVVALPRGGVVTGRIVADALGAPLDLVVPRKIGAQENEEYAIGAITETGEGVWNEDERRRADAAWLKRKIAEEKAEAERRLTVYRAGLPSRDLEGKTVLIVDDGIATGLTMRAAVKTVLAERPERVIVAAPVAPHDVLPKLSRQVDDVIVLEKPSVFGAIGAFYESFDQVDDATVVTLMRAKRL